jgi:hypothetical protein
MLLKQLSEQDKCVFLCTAELLSLADQPMLWDGEVRGPTTKYTKFTNVTVQRAEHRTAALEELSFMLHGRDPRLLYTASSDSGLDPDDIEAALTKRVAALPRDVALDTPLRLEFATEVLRQVLKNQKAKLPSVPKLMLFELLMLCLADGSISNVQWHLLTEFRHHYGLEDFMFHDLLARAQTSHAETQKTLAIILE